MRPGRLLSARARVSQRGLARAFRAIDAVALGALAVIGAELAAGPLLAAELAGVLPFLLAAVAMGAALNAFGAYDYARPRRLDSSLARVAVAAALAAGAGAATTALLGGWTGGGGMLAWGLAAAAVVGAVHLVAWDLVRSWRRDGRLTPNLVFVGATQNARRLVEAALRSGEVAVLGVFDDRLNRAARSIYGVPVLGDVDDLLGHRILPCIDRVVITLNVSAQARVRELIERLRVLPNDVTIFVDMEGAERRGAALSRVTAGAAPRWIEPDERAFSKRVQDLVIGGLALLVAAPVMLLVAALVRLDSPGPVLFRQRRHGFNNEVITVWKFRSMRHEAADPTAQRQVTEGDERVTRVGRFIRRTSLDELPQLLNVLRGEMSIVGPRPHPIGMRTGEDETQRLVAEYAHRHRLKPGITGWAQINGSRGPVHTREEVARRVSLDVEYIERQSLWLDLYIIAMTLPRLLGDRAAVR
jgi:Undecaprenyl-phosphate glucose phosphotransferase